MFIKKLYNYSKAGCIVFLFFIGSFFFINIKQGVVAAPILQFGMFSSVFYISDTQTVAQIYLNDTLLNYADYSFAKRDIILTCLDMYLKQKETNSASFVTMKRLLSKIGIGKWMNERLYSNDITDEQFTNWYKLLLERVTKKSIYKLEIYSQKYLWNGSCLKPTGTVNKITKIAIN
jgi:hypothetical protein